MARSWCVSIFIGLVLLPAFQTGGAQVDTNGMALIFKGPHPMQYRMEAGAEGTSGGTNSWLKVRPLHGSTNTVSLGSRVVLQLTPGTDLDKVIRGHELQRSKTFAPNLYILQAPD